MGYEGIGARSVRIGLNPVLRASVRRLDRMLRQPLHRTTGNAAITETDA